MHFSRLGAVAALAGLSHAFLIPPEISSADTDIITIVPMDTANSIRPFATAGIDGHVVEISCPDCPVVTNINGKVYSVEAESTLQLNFSLSHGNGADQLLLNGQQIYPIDPTQSFMEPLTAAQMIKLPDGTWKYASNPRLGYSLAIGGSPNSEDQLHLVGVHLEIVEVADRFIRGLSAIDLQLLETPSGKLMIGASGVSAPVSSSSPQDGDRECTTILCKWRAIVADRLAALKKGCGSKRPIAEVRPVYEPKPHFKHPEHAHGRPHGHRPWRHHYRQGTIARLLRGIVLHVLVPVLIGVMVGITASLIGMVVGHIVIFTWRLLFRRGQTNYNAVNQVEEVDDSKVFLESQGLPPQYEIVLDEKKEVL